MQTLKSQRGMTAIGWIVVLGLVAFFVLLALRMTPSYLEYFTIKSALESLQNEPGITDKTPAEIRSMIGKRFDVNDVKSITSKDVMVENQGGRLSVSVDYEVREHALGNVDIVMSFDHDVEVVRN